MADEHLGQIFGRDHKCIDVPHRAGTNVEDHLFAITEFKQEARRSLPAALVWHAGAAGDDPDLVLSKHLGARIVDVAVGRDDVGPFDYAACSKD